MAGRIIKLLTGEGRIFLVELNIVRVSEILRRTVEDMDSDEDDDDDIIPLPSITGEIFEKVVQWMRFEYQRGANGDGNPDDDLDENFWMVDLERVIAIAKAASYLEIGRLEDTSCQIIASKLKEQVPHCLHHKIFLPIFP